MSSSATPQATSQVTWIDRAACHGLDPELFFGQTTQSQHQIARFCRSACPSVRACLEFALATDIRHGVWGGTTELERMHLSARRR